MRYSDCASSKDCVTDFRPKPKEETEIVLENTGILLGASAGGG